MEIIFILVATIVVFSLFLVVYFFKERSDDNNSKKPACARCDCHRGKQQDAPFLRHPKQIEKEVLPSSTGPSVKWPASN
jgi:hypothetical protein